MEIFIFIVFFKKINLLKLFCCYCKLLKNKFFCKRKKKLKEKKNFLNNSMTVKNLNIILIVSARNQLTN